MITPDNLDPQKYVKRMNAYSIHVLRSSLPHKLAERLAVFIMNASCGKIRPNDVKLVHVLHSAFDLDEMVDLVGKSKQPLFTTNQCYTIINRLRQDYRIDYCSEREFFLSRHHGTSSFIAKTNIPNKARYEILAELGNYNAKISDILIAEEDFRQLPSVGNTTITCVEMLCREDGVDFWQYFRKD